jgi:ATP-binding cassette subfamily C protein CydD
MRPLDPRLLREAPDARRFLVLATALTLVSALATIAQAVLLSKTIVGAFAGRRGLRELAPELAALAALAFVRAALAWALESAGRLAAGRVAGGLRRRLLEHIAAARPGGLQELRSAEVAVAATEGTRALEPYFARFLPQLMAACIAPPAILVWVGLHDLVSALIMLVTLPLIPVFGILIGKAAQRRTLSRWSALSRMSAHFLDVVSGLVTLRAYRRSRAQVDAIARVSDAFRRETMATLRIAFLSAFVLELAATLGTAVIAVEIGVRLVGGDLGLQAGLTSLVLAPELYGPLRQLSTQFHASADGLAAAERIFSLLALEPSVRVPVRVRPAPDPRLATITLDRVRAGYPDRGAVLEQATLELAPGERVALVGASGSGKSTLLALLLRFLDPWSGRIAVGGCPLADVDPAAWRRLLAWLPQRPHLEAGRVDAVIRGGSGAGQRALARAAEAAGASHLLARQVGEGATGLSAGEQRRIALARALVRDAPILLLDEPTAHLDEESARTVAAAIAALPRTRTVLVATHDRGLSDSCDRALELRDGRLEPLPMAERA